MVDFGRLNHIKHVIERDFDTRSRRVVDSEAICVTRYLGKMKAILELPVAAWDCPATVAGEIDTERKKQMTWNQGNGNGQGSGYGPDDVYGRLNNARDVGTVRFPFLEDAGRFALCTLDEFQSQSDGPCARALFEVLESKGGKHPVGSHVVKVWKLVKPPAKPGMTTEGEWFADFCRKLKGAPPGYPIGNDIRVLMKERPEQQLARGTVIETTTSLREYTKRDGTKAVWTNIYWITVPQTPQDIASMRQRLEQKGIPGTGGGSPATPTQPQMPQQPQYATPQYAQPQYAPPQAQPPQQPQYAPQLPQQYVPPQGNGNGNNGTGGNGSW